MNITEQQFNAVVEGNKVHRQLLHDQVNEKIRVIQQLQNVIQEHKASESRLAEHVNRALDRVTNAEAFIRDATQVARGEGVTTLVDAPGGSELIAEIIRLRDAVTAARMSMETVKRERRSKPKKA